MKAAVAVMLVVLLVPMAACGGGGDPLSLEEYFAKLEDIREEDGDRADAVIDDYEASYADGDDELTGEERDALKQAYRRLLDIRRDFNESIQDIEPPKGLEDEHTEFVDAYAALTDTLANSEDGLDDAQTEAELVALFDIEAPALRIRAACGRLQDAADEAQLDVDVPCDAELKPPTEPLRPM